MPGSFSLWNKDFEVVAHWSDEDEPIYVTLDREDGERVAGLLRLSIEQA